MPLSRARKEEYIARLHSLLGQYNKCFMVDADNVGSQQMHNIRFQLRGKAEVIMGKNTMMRKVFKDFLAENEGHPIGQLQEHIVGNTGFIFTNGDLNEIKKIVGENVVPAPARAGAIAPVDVVIPAGPTGMEPGGTAFFQALNIATKISRGQIEIINDVKLIFVGDKVEPGQSVLLSKLNIQPFSYGLGLKIVYDNGSVYDTKILDMTDDDLTNKFLSGISTVAAVSLELGYPTLASLPHSISKAAQKCFSVCLELDLKIKQMEMLSAAAASGPASGGDGAAAAEEKEEEEEEEEVDMGGGAGLFGDDDDDY